MADPVVAQKGPYEVEVEAGKDYYWCSCGHSATQPFCDGSHKPYGMKPIPWKADKSETKYFCGCKRTGGQPFCDGAHSSL